MNDKWKAERNVLIGGNHLASALLGAGMHPSQYREATYDGVLGTFGQPVTDIWVAWKAIMDWRDVLEAEPPHGE